MSIWLPSCSFLPDLTASSPSFQNHSLPSSGVSPRRRPDGPKARGVAMKMTRTVPSPTVTWRQGNPCPSSTGTSLLDWVLYPWRTWTLTTATRQYESGERGWEQNEGGMTREGVVEGAGKRFMRGRKREQRRT